MTSTSHRQPSRPRLTLRALVLLCSSATAQAKPATAPNIPEPASSKIGADPRASNDPAEDELPLPYTPWQGTGFLPPQAPRAPNLPPPEARPRQLPRRPWELSAALSTFLPNCGSGSLDDRGCVTVSAGAGADLALLYRVTPFFAVGGEAALSGFGAESRGALSAAGGAARFFGVLGRIYFADNGAWDPYLALTLGAGSLTLDSGAATGVTESTTGLGGRIAGGVDYLLGSHFRVGPAASFTRWVAWSEARCDRDALVCRDEPAVYGRLLGFATLGLRFTATLGDVL